MEAKMAKSLEQNPRHNLTTQHPHFMRRKDIENALRLSRSTIYEMMSQDKFPKQFRISQRSVAWRTLDIENYLNDLQDGQND